MGIVYLFAAVGAVLLFIDNHTETNNKEKKGA